MHEWSLAEAIISTALNVTEEEGASEIVSLRILMGELQQVEMDIFNFALENLAKDTKAEGAKFEFELEKAVLKCRVCDYEWKFEDAKEGLSFEESEMIHFIPDVAHTYIRCPECGSPDFKILKGRGVKLDSIKVR